MTLQVEDGVGTIRLDRPKMNAIDEQLHMEVRAAAIEATERDDVRAVVLYGGERVFAAGADIKAMSQLDATGMVAWGRELTALLHRTWPAIPKPVIAAVTGYALGGGYELALCADFRVLGASAKIGQPEILLGVIPGAGGTQRLARLVGPAKAKDLVFTGRHVGAEEALEIGMADAVVPDDEVYSTAVAMARKFAAGPPLALAAAKRAIDEGLDLPIDAGPRAGEPAVRRAVRHRGPEDRHALLPRERPGQGAVSPVAEPAFHNGHHTFVCPDRPARGRGPPQSRSRPARVIGAWDGAAPHQEDTCDEAPCAPRSRS